MDARGARLLRARIAAGAIPGQRVQVVAVANDDPVIRLGARGTIVSFGEAGIRVEFDSGDTVVVDPLSVELRALPRR